MRRLVVLGILLLLPAIGATQPLVSDRVTILVNGHARTLSHAEAVEWLRALIVGLGVVTQPTREDWIRACQARP